MSETGTLSSLKENDRKYVVDFLDRAEKTLSDRVGRITLNVGWTAHSDLNEMSSAVSSVRQAIENIEGDFGYELLEDCKTSLDEMTESIGETQREMLDRELTENDADEDVVMEFMEEKVAELEEAIEDFRGSVA